MGRQFGSADVYDGSSISLNRNRIPGARLGKDKIVLEKEKGQAEKVNGK